MEEQSAYQIMLAKIRAHRSAKEVIRKALKNYDVTVTEWLLLGAIKKHGAGVSTSSLADELNVSAPLISRSNRDLKIKNLLTVKHAKNDKRGRAISLTSEGEELLRTSDKDVGDALKNWLGPIERPNLDTYIKVLMQVAYKL